MNHWAKMYKAEASLSYTCWGMVTHLRISRHDGRIVVCGWDTLQEIKNYVVGEDVRMIEVFPCQHDVVNEANTRHFWEVPDGVEIPSLSWR